MTRFVVSNGQTSSGLVLGSGGDMQVLAGGVATIVGAAALARVLGRIDSRPAAMDVGPADPVV